MVKLLLNIHLDTFAISALIFYCNSSAVFYISPKHTAYNYI